MQSKNAATGIHHKDGPPRQKPCHCCCNDVNAHNFNPSRASVSNNTAAESLNPGASMNKIMTLHSMNDTVPAGHFNNQQLEILKNTICKGVSNEEFEVFLMACIKTQLDPFMRQIYAVKRRGKKPDGTWGETMSIQTGIDGYRLIAERTERYAPGKEPTYTYDPQGHLISSTAYVKKMTRDGTWHEISASAYIDEYMQKTKDGQPMGMWANMPRTMLSKCAEAQALRKSFPAEMSGVYTKEEMSQADNVVVASVSPAPAPVSKLSQDQALEITTLLLDCDENYHKWFYDYVLKLYGSHDLCHVPSDLFERMKQGALKNIEANQERIKREYQEACEGEPVLAEAV